MDNSGKQLSLLLVHCVIELKILEQTEKIPGKLGVLQHCHQESLTKHTHLVERVPHTDGCVLTVDKFVCTHHLMKL